MPRPRHPLASTSGRGPVGRIVLAQLALVAVALLIPAVAGSTAATVGVIAGGVLLAAAVAIPWRGRTAPRRMTDLVGQRLRRRRSERHPAPVVDQMLGRHRMHEAVGPQGSRSALLVDGTRWAGISALHVSGPGPVGGSGATRLPVGELWAAIPPAIRGAALLQVVVQRTQVADGRARWRTWVLLGIDAALCPDAIDARGGGRQGMTRTVLVETARVGVRAGLLGLRLDPLDTAGVRSSVPELLVAEPAATDRLTEGWSECTVAGLAHRTYRQHRWSGTAALASALSGDSMHAAQSVTASLLLTHDDLGLLTVEPLLRVTARVDDLPAVTAEVERMGEAAGLRWAPLDGSQLAGLRATMPLGTRT